MSALLLASWALDRSSGTRRPNSLLNEGRARVPPKKPVSSKVVEGGGREMSWKLETVDDRIEAQTYNRKRRLPYT
jgi:hypothetical protein